MTSKTASALAITAILELTTILGGAAAYAQETAPTAPLYAYDVNAIDRSLMFPYSEKMDSVSDFTQYAAFLSPAMFALAAPVEDWIEIGAIYAGTGLCSYAARTLLKAIIERERPYMYFESPPSWAIEDGDYLKSFPSGHSIMAFSGAGFTAAVLWLRYPDSPYRIPATVGAYALAAATSVLRVGSGSHFVTDVVTGAAIGSIFGFCIPLAVYSLMDSK